MKRVKRILLILVSLVLAFSLPVNAQEDTLTPEQVDRSVAEAKIAMAVSKGIPGPVGGEIAGRGVLLTWEHPVFSEDADESEENSEPEFLEAAQEDFETLESMLREANYGIVLNDTDDVDIKIDNLLRQCEQLYSFFWNDGVESIGLDEALSLNLVSQDYYNNAKEWRESDSIFLAYPADRINWILYSVFDFVPAEDYSSGGTDMVCSCHIDSKYYIQYAPITSVVPVFEEIETCQKQGEYYKIICSYNAYDSEVGQEIRDKIEYTCALRLIDGERCWTIYKYELVQEGEKN